MGPRLRPLRADDRPTIAGLLATTGAFTAEEIAVALELVDIGEADDYHFQIAEHGDVVAGYACYGPDPATDGSWDLYWIAVAPDRLRRGIGRTLLAAAERAATRAGGRTIAAETSSQPSYERARSFYEDNGYEQVARVPGFYAEGDDKLVYRKELAPFEQPWRASIPTLAP